MNIFSSNIEILSTATSCAIFYFAVGCIWSAWEQWTSCSATVCELGLRYKERSIEHQVAKGRKPCEPKGQPEKNESCFGDNCYRSHTCPTEDSRYLNIDGKCFYFEKNFLNYTVAKANCEEKLKLQGQGKLYEPKTLAENEKIADEFQTLFGHTNYPIIGVTNLSQKGPSICEAELLNIEKILAFQSKTDWGLGPLEHEEILEEPSKVVLTKEQIKVF